MNIRREVTEIARKAQNASRQAVTLSTSLKNKVIEEMALAVLKSREYILKANKKDLLQAKSNKLGAVFIDRLALNDKRIQDMSISLVEVAKLKDPVGEVIKEFRRPNGLLIRKIRVPIGVIAIIYESRPNVTADCIGLCFKSGNSVILKGGSESLNSNIAVYKTLQNVLSRHNIAEGMINIISTKKRSATDELLKLDNYIDLVIPRGGESLIKKIAEISRIPVIKHYKGVCHVYVDDYADLNMAQDICFNAKVQRPGVCNAMESMLVHQDVAMMFLPRMLNKFRDAGVQIRGCNITKRIAKWVKKATDKDYYTEYLGLVLSVKVVKSLDEAIEHINHYGSHHSDTIVTRDNKNAEQFLRVVDSACVYVNASTRFTDGYQFGMGAEIGISTDKLHARGPMALEELTTYKYQVTGNGQVRN